MTEDFVLRDFLIISHFQTKLFFFLSLTYSLTLVLFPYDVHSISSIFSLTISLSLSLSHSLSVSLTLCLTNSLCNMYTHTRLLIPF